MVSNERYEYCYAAYAFIFYMVFGHATWKTDLTFCLLGSEFLDVLGLFVQTLAGISRLHDEGGQFTRQLIYSSMVIHIT